MLSHEEANGAGMPRLYSERWTDSACSGSARGVEPVVRCGFQSPDAPLIGQQRRDVELSQGLMEMGPGRGVPSFLLSNSGMFADSDEGQSDECIGRVAMAAIHLIAVRDRILALRAAAVRIEVFEVF